MVIHKSVCDMASFRLLRFHLIRIFQMRIFQHLNQVFVPALNSLYIQKYIHGVHPLEMNVRTQLFPYFIAFIAETWKRGMR